MKTMKVTIEAQVLLSEAESREQIEQKVDSLLEFGTVRDSFAAAGIDLYSLQVSDTPEAEGTIECLACDKERPMNEEPCPHCNQPYNVEPCDECSGTRFPMDKHDHHCSLNPKNSVG